jgi:hypothetical protein
MSGTVLTIILNYRTAEMTLRSAEAALQAMADLPGEIVIVDNDSGDGSYETLVQEASKRGWPDSGRLRVVSSGRNGGFGAGMNFGMETGLSDGRTPDYYYLLNSDAFPEAGTIRTLRDFLASHPGAGLAGSHVHGEDGTPHCTAFRFPTITAEFEGAVRFGPLSRLLRPWIVAMEIPQDETQVDWTAGASLMVSRRVIEATGGFDETFFLYYEETDLCRRAAKAGWRTHYVPQSRIPHIGSVSTGMKGWDRTPKYFLDSRLHYFTKNHGAGYAAAATLARLAGGLIWQARRLVQGKPELDPPYFLRDLCAHSLCAMFRRPTPEISETRCPDPVPEEQK